MEREVFRVAFPTLMPWPCTTSSVSFHSMAVFFFSNTRRNDLDRAESMWSCTSWINLGLVLVFTTSTDRVVVSRVFHFEFEFGSRSYERLTQGRTDLSTKWEVAPASACHRFIHHLLARSVVGGSLVSDALCPVFAADCSVWFRNPIHRETGSCNLKKKRAEPENWRVRRTSITCSFYGFQGDSFREDERKGRKKRKEEEDCFKGICCLLSVGRGMRPKSRRRVN